MSEEIDLALKNITYALSLVATDSHRCEAINYRDILARTKCDLNNLTFLDMADISGNLMGLVIQSWNQLGTDMIELLYELRWSMIDILTEENLNNLSQTYQSAMEAMNSDRLLDQFQQVKLTERTPPEEYPAILTSYNQFLNEHKSETRLILDILTQKLTPIYNELKTKSGK